MRNETRDENLCPPGIRTLNPRLSGNTLEGVTVVSITLQGCVENQGFCYMWLQHFASECAG